MFLYGAYKYFVHLFVAPKQLQKFCFRNKAHGKTPNLTPQLFVILLHFVSLTNVKRCKTILGRPQI